MKIGFLLPTLFASRTLYGDRIFAPRDLAMHLINGLVARGHEVTVFSTPDFVTNGTLVATGIDAPVWKLAYSKLSHLPEKEQEIRTDEAYKRHFEIACCTSAYKYCQDHEIPIIHSFHDFLFTPHYLEELTHIPTVYTIHDRLPQKETIDRSLYLEFKNHRYISISQFQKTLIPELTFVGTVYHGTLIPKTDTLVTRNHYAFVGRMVPDKGLETALAVCIAQNEELNVASNVPGGKGENSYFDKEIAADLDNDNVNLLGVIDAAARNTLLSQAKALLFPVHWDEPFGMVMIEAMACGAPVIAYNRGSIPEVLFDGKTGFIIDPPEGDETPYPLGTHIIKARGKEGFIEAMKRIGEIDPSLCMAHVINNFSIEKMAEGYEQVYTKVLAK